MGSEADGECSCGLSAGSWVNCVAGKRVWCQVSDRAKGFEGAGDSCGDRNGDGCGDRNGDANRVLRSTSLRESFVGNAGICI